MFSLTIPVYRNESSIPFLLPVLEDLNRRMGGDLEVVFVVDGSPDRSAALLADALPRSAFESQLIVLSRNFGAFAAITAGLAAARGPLLAIMAAAAPGKEACHWRRECLAAWQSIEKDQGFHVLYRQERDQVLRESTACRD